MYFSHFPLTLLFILPLCGIACLVASFSKGVGTRTLILLFFTSFIIAELISIYFSGGFIDYQFFVNLNWQDIIAGLTIFRWQAALSLICFIAAICLLFYLTRYLANKCSLLSRVSLLVVMIMVVSYKEGPLIKLSEIYQITMVKNKTFEDSLKQIAMADYVTKTELESEAGKNIIVISLESFERGFLEIPNMAPNLQQLSTRYSYYPMMRMVQGSSWTTASMYTYMTGVPFLIGTLSTTPMEKAKATKLVSLGDILGLAGYRMRYIIGNPDFSGIGDIISLFGIEVVSEKNYPNRYPNAPFGLYDHDIFDIAKQEVIKLRRNKLPFALFISTISTHAPSGFRDDRMQKYIGSHEDDMKFSAVSLDYSLGKFIRFLEKNHILDNTVFYIFPDHLMMGAGTSTMAKLTSRPRSLYLISNAKEIERSMPTTTVLHQIDLPRLILNGAAVKTNAKFLTDYLSAKDKTEFIQTHRQRIAQLNNAAIMD